MDGGICRVKLDGGSITALQARAVADVAQRYASGVIEATNRGNLQIRGVGPQHRALIEPLLAAGLGPATAASDDVRNLMLSPSAGIDPQMHIDTWPLARQILASLQSTPRFAELSAKFAVQLDGGEALAMLEHPHDLWLSAFRRDGQTLLAFGLAGCPAHDPALAAVPAEYGHELVMAVLMQFLDLARPEHIRMRHLLEEVSAASFVGQQWHAEPLPQLPDKRRCADFLQQMAHTDVLAGCRYQGCGGLASGRLAAYHGGVSPCRRSLYCFHCPASGVLCLIYVFAESTRRRCYA
jgi:precorrin-3B synthase